MADNVALQYCRKAVAAAETPRYVKAQMREFIEIAEGRHPEFEVNDFKLAQLEGLLKLINLPKGLSAGKSFFDAATSYQWLAWTAILCVTCRGSLRRRYEIGLLEIARQNYKTATIAVLLLILMMTEPAFGEYYSVAPDGALSGRIKSMMVDILEASPALSGGGRRQRFKVLLHEIKYLPGRASYKPLAFSTSRMDGRTPQAWVADEVGALATDYPIEAMKSGQTNVTGRLGFIISTKYPTIDNPFEEIVGYAKKVLDGKIADSKLFALLYEPDDFAAWESSDLMLAQANPAALAYPQIMEDLRAKRSYALAVESARENFLTKHCNIVYQGVGTESYVDVNDVRTCRAEEIDWRGRDVYVGLDLSLTTDNTSIAIAAVADDGETILSDVYAFIPSGRIEEKTRAERVRYADLLGDKVFSCGDRVIDYGFIEDFIMGKKEEEGEEDGVLSLEERLGCRVIAIGFDPWNALSTAQKLERAGYNMIEIKQHSSVLHSPTKLLKEKILKKEFCYPKNKLLEINFQNAKCSYDSNLNMYVHKKKSRGKVDMVISLINAVAVLEKDYFVGHDEFFVHEF